MDTTLISDIDMSNFTSITDRPVNTNCDYIILPNLPEMKSRIDEWQKIVSNNYYKNNSRNEEIKYKMDSCVCKVFTTFTRWSIHIDLNLDVSIVGEIYHGQQLKTLPITRRISDKIVQDSSGLVYTLNTPDFRANTISESMKSVFINGFPQDWQKFVKLQHPNLNTSRNSDSGNCSVTTKTKNAEINSLNSDSVIFSNYVVSGRNNTLQKKCSVYSSVHNSSVATNVTYIKSNEVKINGKLNYCIKSNSMFDETSDSGNDEIIKKKTIISNKDQYNSTKKSILNITKTKSCQINLTPLNRKPLKDIESDYSEKDETTKTKTIPNKRSNKKLNFSHSTFISIFDDTSDSENNETKTNQYKNTNGNEKNSTENSVSNKIKINNSQRTSNRKPLKDIETNYSDKDEVIKKQCMPNHSVNINADKNNSIKNSVSNITNSQRKLIFSNRKRPEDIESDSDDGEIIKKQLIPNRSLNTNADKNNSIKNNVSNITNSQRKLRLSNRKPPKYIESDSDNDETIQEQVIPNRSLNTNADKNNSIQNNVSNITNSQRKLRLSNRKPPKYIESDSDNDETIQEQVIPNRSLNTNADKNNSIQNNVSNITNSQRKLRLSNRKPPKYIESDSDNDETIQEQVIPNRSLNTNADKNNSIQNNVSNITNSQRNLIFSNRKRPEDIESDSDDGEIIKKQLIPNRSLNTNADKNNSIKNNVSNITNSQRKLRFSNRKPPEDIESDSDNDEIVIPNRSLNTNADKNNSIKNSVSNITKINKSERNITSTIKDIESDNNSNKNESTKKKTTSNYYESTNGEKKNRKINYSNENRTQFVSILDESSDFSEIDVSIKKKIKVNDYKDTNRKYSSFLDGNDVKSNSSKNLNKKPLEYIESGSDNGEIFISYHSLNTNADKNNSIRNSVSNITNSQRKLRFSNRKSHEDIENDSDNDEIIQEQVIPNHSLNINADKNNSIKNNVSNITNSQRKLRFSNRKPPEDIESDSDNDEIVIPNRSLNTNADKNNSIKNNVSNITNNQRKLILSNRKRPEDIESDSDDGETIQEQVIPKYSLNSNADKNNSIKNNVSNITNNQRKLILSNRKPPEDIESDSDKDETIQEQVIPKYSLNTNADKNNSIKNSVSNITNSQRKLRFSNRKPPEDIESDSDNGEIIQEQVIFNRSLNTNADKNNSIKNNVSNITNNQRKLILSNRKRPEDIESDSDKDETIQEQVIPKYSLNTNADKNNSIKNSVSNITNSQRKLRFSNRKPPEDIESDSDNGEIIQEQVIPNRSLNTNADKNNSIKNSVSNITNNQRNLRSSNRKPPEDIESNNSKKKAINGKKENITDISNKKSITNRKGKEEIKNVPNLYDRLPSNNLKSMAEESKNQHLLSLSESIYVSRRGRTVYPPLKYWLGESVDVINDETVYIPGNVESYEEVNTVSKTINNKKTGRGKYDRKIGRGKYDRKKVNSKNKTVKKNSIPEVIRINQTEIENKKDNFENDSSDNNKTNFKRKRKLFSQNNSFSDEESVCDSVERHVQVVDSFNKAGNGRMFVTKNQNKPGGSIAFTDFSLVSNV